MSSPSAGSRRAALTVVFALIVAGCAASPSAEGTIAHGAKGARSSTAAQVAELDALLVRAAAQPAYSAQMTSRTLIDGELLVSTAGRANLNNKAMTGHFTTRTVADGDDPARTVQSVITFRATYARVLGKGSQKGDWQKTSSAGAPSIANLTGYARLLLKRGPAADKGIVTLDGIQATRLSGDLASDDIQTLDPSLYARLQKAGVTYFACTMWVDGTGRVVRLEQRITMDGYEVHNVELISDFGPRFLQKKPADYSPPQQSPKKAV